MFRFNIFEAVASISTTNAHEAYSY